MASLIIKENRARSRLARQVLGRRYPHSGEKFCVPAGKNSLVYTYFSEIRFGANYHRVVFQGPGARKITPLIKDRLFFINGEPYFPERRWYAFEELTNPADLSCRIIMCDLGSGKVLGEIEGDSLAVLGWRTGSSELIYTRLYDWSWHARDALTGRKRKLFDSAQDGWLSSDGRWLFLLDLNEFSVILLDLETGKPADIKTKKDFRKIFRPLKILRAVSFEPDAARLTLMLNLRSTDYRKRVVDFDAAVTIEVAED